ncbi:uncharacterized protein AKAW2_31540S [Aspergillus luchuensis]|uniref:Uncharacterized protein n=1 Tax=Aspergillus kawachii TaxID=1069201 RepID=A0A7R7W8B0_ASPKA|nr:uncharacterized protein AKAW2_31540S [Aspergillus luchuensis]BCR98221.1 hypothetical protein AKAW2_31540S [Aspergillus luchuensis]
MKLDNTRTSHSAYLSWMMPYASVFLFFLDHPRPHALQGSFLPSGPTLHSGDVRAGHSVQSPLSGALFCLRRSLLCSVFSELIVY